MKRICKVEGCERRVLHLGFCRAHYHRFKKYGDPMPDVPLKARNGTYHNATCLVEDCNSKPVGQGYCQRHYAQIRKHGKITNTGTTRYDPNPITMKGDVCEIHMCGLDGKPNGVVARVDAEDYFKIKNCKWYANSKSSYVYTDSLKPRTALHQFIMGIVPTGDKTKTPQVDHKNQDKLDCRKENMRLCTQLQNNMNRCKNKGTNKYKGVYTSPSGKRHLVYIQKKFIGSYKSEIDAALAYNSEAKKRYGEFAVLNKVLIRRKRGN